MIESLFFVNTGAQILLFPSGNVTNKTPSNFKLYAANNTCINTYGESFRILHLGVHSLTWKLLRSISPVSNYWGRLDSTLSSRLSKVTDSSIYKIIYTCRALLNQYYSEPSSAQSIPVQSLCAFYLNFQSGNPQLLYNSDVRHHIITTSLPVAERPRRLSQIKGGKSRISTAS